MTINTVLFWELLIAGIMVLGRYLGHGAPEGLNAPGRRPHPGTHSCRTVRAL